MLSTIVVLVLFVLLVAIDSAASTTRPSDALTSRRPANPDQRRRAARVRTYNDSFVGTRAEQALETSHR